MHRPHPDPPEAGSADIGVFGGSGFYEWLGSTQPITMDTPYGEPSGAIAIAEVAGRRVAFLPRHGPRHTIPPHLVNYRANVWAMHELGVRRIIGPSAVGSLQPQLHPATWSSPTSSSTGRRDEPTPTIRVLRWCT